MKFSLKFAVILLIITMLSAVSVVYAQSITGENTVSPTSSNLNAVTIVSNTSQVSNANLVNSDAWAVGDSGTIIQWNGTRWSTVNSNTTSNLYGVVFVNSTVGWAVGGGSNNGVIQKYNGTWYAVNTTNVINSTLYSVTMDSTGATGWAVGANGIIVRWNGNNNAWTIQPNQTTNNLRSVAMIHGLNEAWVVGDNGTILHFDGANWSNMTSTTTTQLNAIVMVNSSMGWAVGGNSSRGIILNLNGTTWSNWNRINFGGAGGMDTINSTLYSLTMDTANSSWASGASGVVAYWTGTEWAGQTNIASNDLRGIAMVHGAPSGTSYAWAVGNGGRILAWTGTSWIPEFPVAAIPVLMGIIVLSALLGKIKFGKKITL